MPVTTYDGDPIADVRYPRLAGRDVPAIVGIKRATFHGILTAAIEARSIPYSFGSRIADTLPDGHRVHGVTRAGLTSAYDLIVAADGIRSTLRGVVFPDRALPRYSGFGAWRCICPRPPDLVHKLMLIGPGARLGIMPISNSELYMFGITPEPKAATVNPAEWPTLMRERFGTFQGRAPDLFSAASTFHYTAVEEVPAEQPLAARRVVLIGDAAHATTPFMGQGGSMALEDAVVLAEELKVVDSERTPDVESALARFEERRFRRVEFVQRRSFEAGKSWGGDGSAYDPAALRSTMQARVDRFYEVIAGPI
jgi:2-polyprenyl-6-methoxyphenol hydroxylase-like FAD-dependent oxidoreductase